MDHQPFTLEIFWLKRHNQAMHDLLQRLVLCVLLSVSLGQISPALANPNPLPVKQYLESILGPGVQVNISEDTGQDARQERRITRDTPQIAAQKTQQQKSLQNATQNTERTQQETRWTYNTTETLSNVAAQPGKRSITVVYPASADHSPESVEQLVKAVVGLKPDETLVVQAYNPPAAPAFAKQPEQKLWLWALACVFLGLFLGLGAGFYWRRRQQQQKIAYNEASGVLYSNPQFIEDSSHASKLQ